MNSKNFTNGNFAVRIARGACILSGSPSVAYDEEGKLLRAFAANTAPLQETLYLRKWQSMGNVLCSIPQ